MQRIAAIALVATAALAAGGCTTTSMRSGPVEVTRYHLGSPISRGTVSIEPLSATTTISPEYQTYASAVAAELARLGFTPVAQGAESQFVAGLSFVRASRGVLQERSPVSIGLGGGTGGYRSGLGGGISFGLGGGPREVILSELSVQLRSRAADTVVWEGRAVTDAVQGTDAAQPGLGAQRLADALFRGFPGESGITITVP